MSSKEPRSKTAATRTGSSHRWIVPIIGLFLFGVAVAVSYLNLKRTDIPQATPTSGPIASLVTVAHPQVTNAEALVRAHIQEARVAVDQTVTTNGSRAVLAKAWENLGKAYFCYEFYTAASGCFSNALALNSQEPAVWLGLAECQFELGDFPGSMAGMGNAFRQLAAQGKTNSPLQTVVLCFLGDAAERLGQTDSARRHFETVLAQEPKDLYALIKAGKLAAQAGDETNAVARLEQAFALAPHRREIAALLSQVHRKMGRSDRADELSKLLQTTDRTRKVAELERSDPWRAGVMALNRSSTALNQKGIVSMKAGQYRSATEAFEAAVRASPTNIATRVNLAYCRLAENQAVSAGEIFLAVLREDPASDPARKGLALALAHTGRVDDAVRFCAMWRKQQPDNLQALQTEAEIQMEARQYQLAENAYLQLKEKDPSGVIGPVGLATAQAASRRYLEARETLEKAAQTLEGRSEVLHTLARLLTTSPDPSAHDPKRALEITDSLMRSDSLITISETRALALAQLGRWAEGESLLRTALSRPGGLGETDTARRLAKVQKSLESRQPFRELWPFAPTNQE